MTRERVARWVESNPVQHFIVGLIVFNAITLGLETAPSIMADWGALLHQIDQTVLGVFVVEIALRIYAHGWRFFRDPWGVFDFTIVAIALIPSSGPFAVLRALRILRVLRLISMVPQLRMVVGALLHAIPGITAIAGLMVILYYVFAVMATGLFGSSHPQWFGSVGESMYTLFQVMTLESWSMGIVRPVMETHPQAWLFFIPFILIATFTILNLFIAIIVDTMQTMSARQREAEEQAITAVVHDEGGQLAGEIGALRREIGELRDMLREKR